MTSCPSANRFVIRTTTSGFLSNTLWEFYTAVGRVSCPWVIEASTGQRLQLVLVSLDSAISGVAQLCPRVVVIDRTLDQSAEFNVCVRRSRERHIFTSTGNHVTVYTKDDFVHEARFIISYNGSHYHCHHNHHNHHNRHHYFIIKLS